MAPAEEAPPAAPPAMPTRPRHEWVSAELDLWFAFSHRERIWSDEHHQNEAAGVPFDFGELGVRHNAYVPLFTLGFHPTRADHLEFNLWFAAFSGKGNADQAFAYDGNAFAKDDRLDSEFNLDHYRLAYRRDILEEEKFGIDLWLGLGGSVVQYDNSIDPLVSAQTVTATEHLLGIFSLGGIGLGKRFWDRLDLSLEAWFGLVGGAGRGTGNYFDQRYIDLALKARYEVTPHFDIILAYKFFDFSLRSREHGEFINNSEQDLEQIRMSGPVLGIAFSY
ncbi:MAG: hypothetical protein HY717_05985 [Planctomycetes bacterium]|nr:hypothetical protein [Planctomycetota bacterium]